jgi:hypothetical protein
VHEKAERGAGGERGEHSRLNAVEVEGDDRERAGDDHAHAGGESVHAVGEVDHVHHRDEPEHGQRRTGVGGARFGERERADERQRDRLDHHAEVHDDHRRRDLTGELDDRRQVVAVVERPYERDERRGEQDPVPQPLARAIAGGQEGERRDEHAGEDREAAEQRGRAFGQTALAWLVDGADRPRQAHRERCQQRGYGPREEEGVKRVELVQMRHRPAKASQARASSERVGCRISKRALLTRAWGGPFGAHTRLSTRSHMARVLTGFENLWRVQVEGG